jgi:serine/threonine-protein kinase RsbW
MEIQIALHLPRDAVSVPVGRQVLDSCLETLGVAPDTRADIALALGEACANVIQHAGPGEEYEVQVSTRNCRCTIEVVNTGSTDGEERSNGFAVAVAVADEPVPATAEHGRGLKIIEAVVDNLRLTGNARHGTTVHFEKTLEWVPGAAGRHLFVSGR